MTFGVILFSLLVQGLTMEPLLRRLGVITPGHRHEQYQAIRARRSMAVAALAEIDRISLPGGLSSDVLGDLRHKYAEELEGLDKELQDIQVRDEDLRRDFISRPSDASSRLRGFDPTALPGRDYF